MALAGGTDKGYVVAVDDDAVLRAAVRLVLEAAGFDVATAVDGRSAAELVGRRRPDAILLDVNLPDSEGLGLLPVLRDLADGAPVVMLTGNDDAAFVRAALGAGAHDYITKPFVEEVLVARVAAATRLGRTLRALEEANRRLRRLAEVDDLTGLPNRRALRAQLETTIAAGERGGSQFGVILLDLDGFKLINDSHGHATGDLALVTVADTLLTVCRRGDIVGRWGGDEFLALVGQATAAQLDQAARRYARAVADAVPGISLSTGFAAWGTGEDAGALLARADAELYTAKRQRLPPAPTC